MEIIRGVDQGTEEWHDIRRGKVTASRFKDVMTNPRGSDKISKTSESYMMELISELVTNEKPDGYTSSAMQWGIDTEPRARIHYELMTDSEVEEVTFIVHNEFIGVSPDGLVGDNGMLEIKCPNTKTQLDRYIKGIELPSEYKWQVMGQLWVAEREWCDFLSYDPRITEGQAGYICNRIHRDEKLIKELSAKVYGFVDIMKEKLEKVRGY